MRISAKKSSFYDFADTGRICPSRSITQLAWRRRKRKAAAPPVRPDDSGDEYTHSAFELAVASEDTSVRIYSIASLDVEI